VENSIAAMAVAFLNGVTEDELRTGIASFQGIRRRFDFHVKKENMVYLDDYAHHPTELTQSINSIKALFPTKKVCGIFQPHLYTRTRDFYREFSEALSLLDELILLDIYPAREQLIEGVSSQLIFDNVTCKNKTLCTKQELMAELPKHQFDVLVTLGAGDIDKFIPEITAYCKNL
ncbi:MAG: UDP-N-acetylmuramate--L-alanine ligase, partial [Paludibacteraceae bacterium]|nr:UDP-N-acetylmuramate--L-alanine ligase [Paludibacteraceae bacterium]